VKNTDNAPKITWKTGVIIDYKRGNSWLCPGVIEPRVMTGTASWYHWLDAGQEGRLTTCVSSTCSINTHPLTANPDNKRLHHGQTLFRASCKVSQGRVEGGKQDSRWVGRLAPYSLADSRTQRARAISDREFRTWCSFQWSSNRTDLETASGGHLSCQASFI
jgi:hypothetical protein